MAIMLIVHAKAINNKIDYSGLNPRHSVYCYTFFNLLNRLLVKHLHDVRKPKTN